MNPRKTLVKRYLRRHPKTPEAVVRSALGELRRLKADQNLKHVCRLQVSDEDSQVMAGKTGFRRRACSVANIEHGDTHDEVEAATTIFHEALHAKDIATKGPSAITKANEVKAHKDTILFLRDWKTKETRAAIRRRLDEEIAEEQMSIQVLVSSREN
jgi:hypothetical protein